MKMYQQGDVLLKTCDKLPEGAKPVAARPRGFVLADGEVTGHAHVIEDTTGVELVEVNGTLYMKCAEDRTLTHEEHKAIHVPAGCYEIGIVQEYDHFTEEARAVRD